METTTCGCGLAFAVPSHWLNARREDRTGFYCPAGHPLRYVEKTRADLLAEELSRVRQQLAEAHDTAREADAARVAAERQAATARGQVTRLNRRAAAGVCPCCNRTFQALAKHMATKHPAFRGEEPSNPLQ
jgi:hypothetical protein